MADYILVYGGTTGDTINHNGQAYTVYGVGGQSPLVVDAADGDSFLIAGDGVGSSSDDNVPWTFTSTSGGGNIAITIDSTANSPVPGGAGFFFEDSAGGASLSPTVNVEDGAQYAIISLAHSAGGTVNVGENATLDTIQGSEFADTITIGDGVTLENMATFGGDDVINVGDNVYMSQALQAGLGNDNVTIGENFTMGGTNAYVGGGDGNDTITIGDGFSSAFGGADVQGNAGDDSISVGSYNTNSTLGNNANNEYAINGGAGGNDTITLTGLTTDEQTEFDADLAASGLTQQTDGSYTGNANSDTDISINPSSSSYSYDIEDFNNYAPVCFGRGTMIETDHGVVAIEDLAKGDLIMTRDNGLQPIRWIGSKSLDAEVLAKNEKLRPIRIKQHALGNNIPSSDLLVSPQHRVLVRSAIATRMFGAQEVLIAAKHLCQVDGIDIAQDLDTVEYYHMLFDQHQVVISNGAETESLFTGPQALKSVGPAALDEIFSIFPELRNSDFTPASARYLPTGRKARQLAVRHKENSRALVS